MKNYEDELTLAETKSVEWWLKNLKYELEAIKEKEEDLTAIPSASGSAEALGGIYSGKGVTGKPTEVKALKLANLSGDARRWERAINKVKQVKTYKQLIECHYEQKVPYRTVAKMMRYDLSYIHLHIKPVMLMRVLLELERCA